MPWNRFLSFKTGVKHSLKTHINPEALTPTQKMDLARNRIWGNVTGGNLRSGYKELKCEWRGREKSRYYEHAHLNLLYPFFDKWEEHNFKKIKYEDRKQRIYMRGIKIGREQKPK